MGHPWGEESRPKTKDIGIDIIRKIYWQINRKKDAGVNEIHRLNILLLKRYYANTSDETIKARNIATQQNLIMQCLDEIK